MYTHRSIILTDINLKIGTEMPARDQLQSNVYPFVIVKLCLVEIDRAFFMVESAIKKGMVSQ